MSIDVAIVGIGMHEFGRTEGVSGMDQGVIAVRRASEFCNERTTLILAGTPLAV